ncbi:N-acetylmuramoyl-L-alanine amidase CwlD [Bacillaceae bacterium Marseille-Q3522]|nr:N-acetylmuramoyl-L-alanine amidase CwlD [Bacillaceae bacterium Marseille-Q3522]
MRKRLKQIVFIIGLIVLFFILQYDFTDKLSWKSWNLPLSGKIIVLDPGHGGPDGGAGDAEALEKDIALIISLKLKEYLQEQGALVIMTRETDKDLADDATHGYSRRKAEDLKARLDIINDSEADLFLSIHLNALSSPSSRGAQTFYAAHKKENKEIAKFIQAEFTRNLENTHRLARPISNIYILKNAKKPGALVEVGFLSNPREKELLKTEDYQEKLAASIYNGLLRYVSNEKNLPDPKK